MGALHGCRQDVWRTLKELCVHMVRVWAGKGLYKMPPFRFTLAVKAPSEERVKLLTRHEASRSASQRADRSLPTYSSARVCSCFCFLALLIACGAILATVWNRRQRSDVKPKAPTNRSTVSKLIAKAKEKSKQPPPPPPSPPEPPLPPLKLFFTTPPPPPRPSPLPQRGHAPPPWPPASEQPSPEPSPPPPPSPPPSPMVVVQGVPIDDRGSGAIGR